MKIDIDLKNVKEPDEFGLIPGGYYKAIILSYEKKTKKEQDASLPYYYIELKIRIIEGSYTGRILFYRLNLCNENQKIMEWHQGVLKKLLRLCGHPDGNEFDMLLNHPLMIEVLTRPLGKGDLDAKIVNDIKHFLEINDTLLAIKYTTPVRVTKSLPSQDELNDDIPF